MKIEAYNPSAREEWNSFITASRNGTFLFDRAYMEYHADRFPDHSRLMRNDKGELLAIFPASAAGDTVTSHGGLTYGGCIMSERMTAPLMLRGMTVLIESLKAEGFRQLIYKTIPRIFHRMPADEDQYALFSAGAELYRRDVWSVIEQSRRPPLQERRERSLRKAARRDLHIQETQDFAAFWEILAANLHERYGLKPVHSLEEILLLRSRFPLSIRLFGCFEGPLMMAGAVVYDTGSVAHVQYNAASPQGKELGALDLLLETLISQTYSSHAYFDLGSSTETDGRYLNRGLVEQKEGFGARTIAHDFYRLDLTNWQPQRMECGERSTRAIEAVHRQ
ncbi:MAG TPA: hypothetical protein VN519_12670 [Bryobacteraceae bacterium]|nr:hypothetical protein [Bryobacteraceae bacterium]